MDSGLYPLSEEWDQPELIISYILVMNIVFSGCGSVQFSLVKFALVRWKYYLFTLFTLTHVGLQSSWQSLTHTAAFWPGCVVPLLLITPTWSCMCLQVLANCSMNIVWWPGYPYTRYFKYQYIAIAIWELQGQPHFILVQHDIRAMYNVFMYSSKRCNLWCYLILGVRNMFLFDC